MKYISLILILLISISLNANMAEPMDRGTLGSAPFLSQYVDIIHEDIVIKLDDQFKTANYEIIYHINSSKEGIQIPFMFYASEYLNDFKISIDGEEINLKKAPDYYDELEDTTFRDFSYFFEKDTLNDYSNIHMSESNSRGFYVNIYDMLYFETNLTQGKHTIKVTYTATNWEDRWDYIKKYSFRYALSPAKYWKSFGSLNITLDAKNFKNEITTNLGKPEIGNENEVAMWKFDSIPNEVIVINYTPKVSKTALTLANFGAKNLALILFALLGLLHLTILIKKRKKNPTKPFLKINTLYIITIPLIFVLSWFYLNYFIDFMIGEAASEEHGYSVLVFMLYPILLPLYWIFVFLLDKAIKKNI